jgi:diaminopimelate epimerase
MNINSDFSHADKGGNFIRAVAMLASEAKNKKEINLYVGRGVRDLVYTVIWIASTD